MRVERIHERAWPTKRCINGNLRASLSELEQPIVVASGEQLTGQRSRSILQHARVGLLRAGSQVDPKHAHAPRPYPNGSRAADRVALFSQYDAQKPILDEAWHEVLRDVTP